MGLGLSGLRGLGGLGGGSSGMGQPSAQQMSPGQSGPLAYGAVPTQNPTRGSGSTRGQLAPDSNPGALGQLGMATKLGSMGANAMGYTGAGGALGAAGGALGTAGSLSRVMAGNATPMDYAALAKAGYSAYTAGAGAGASAAGAAGAGTAGAGAAGAGSAGVAGSSGAAAGGGAGASAGMAAYALPAAVVLAGIMGWNEPGQSNEAKLSGYIGSQGGTRQGMLDALNREISMFDPKNYASLADSARNTIKSQLGYSHAAGAEGGGTSLSQYIDLANKYQDPDQAAGALSSYATPQGYFYRGVFDDRIDPALMENFLGKDTVADVKKRYTEGMTRTQKEMYPFLQQSLKSNPLLDPNNPYGFLNDWQMGNKSLSELGALEMGQHG